ncbi:hypothetical protein [Spirosoma flavum]|uniref:Uncharacterized protein n=1 Tax=Spirosoma flavum TaxID=2048557 RepID=A0ABW6ATQ6_9BACT
MLLSITIWLSSITLVFSQFNVSDHIKEVGQLTIKDFIIPEATIKGATYYQATKQGVRSGFTSTRSYIVQNELAIIKENRLYDGNLVSSKNSVIEFNKYDALVKSSRNANIIEENAKNSNKSSILLKMPSKPEEFVTWTEVESDGTIIENKAHFFVYRHYDSPTKFKYILGIQVLSTSSNSKLNLNSSMVYEYAKGLGFVRSLIKDKTLNTFVPFDILDELIPNKQVVQRENLNRILSTKYLTSSQYDSLINMKKRTHDLKLVNPIAYEKTIALLRKIIKVRIADLSEKGDFGTNTNELAIPAYNYFSQHREPFILNETYSYNGFYRFEEDRTRNFSDNGIISANGNYSFSSTASNKVKSTTRYFEQLLPKAPIFPAADSSGVDMSTRFGLSEVEVHYIKGVTTIKVKKGVITFQKNDPPSGYQQLIINSIKDYIPEGSFLLAYEGGSIMGEPYIITKKLE